MLVHLPREVKNTIYSYVGHDLNWSDLKKDMHSFTAYCTLYWSDYKKHRCDVTYYAKEEMWVDLQGASRHWKKEGKELREIIVAAALNLQVLCHIHLPPGVHYNDNFE